MKSLVAIVGRPNVGKSTFFNRLVQRRDAIVDAIAGVTRDRHYGHSEWIGKHFNIVDTGGYVQGSEDIFEGEIRKQVEAALTECDAILFLVDVEDGITHDDKEIAAILRRQDKPVVLVANKVDNHQRAADAAEFYTLGLGEPICMSSINGSGSGEVLDALVQHIPDTPEGEGTEDPWDGLPKLAIVGRPNVGKSSLTNALFEEEKSIVTDIAGTTRDTVNAHFNKFGMEFILLDTAGLRKKGKVNQDLEFYSNMRSIRTIEESDVCILVIDATQGFESQDLSILNVIEKNHKGLVILVNKWDLVEKDHKSMDEYKKLILERTKPFVDIPVIFTSAITKQRVLKGIEEAMDVYKRRSSRITTSKLNDEMLPVVKHMPPPIYKGKEVKIKYITQLPTHYPQFVYFCNLPQYVKEPYYRYVENQMRKHYDFTGVPMEIYFRKK
ncbi:MAG: ribosome biogenesis GTPase Der [Schleiferiaceae bacterium]|jgi:GTPase|nr:MAG: ribosome-associated GTPase EngA [Cryomorphaceae bacterium BACL23 MAG-120924-bin60]MDP5067641.1 ribosome biogenesis GTPase Der [Schleiferiaceae bacterium]